jgi:hypothetical protein
MFHKGVYWRKARCAKKAVKGRDNNFELEKMLKWTMRYDKPEKIHRRVVKQLLRMYCR